MPKTTTPPTLPDANTAKAPLTLIPVRLDEVLEVREAALRVRQRQTTCWVPRSQLHRCTLHAPQGQVVLMPDWLARKKSLEPFDEGLARTRIEALKHAMDYLEPIAREEDAPQNWVRVYVGRVLRHTERAVLVARRYTLGARTFKKEIWLPRSCCALDVTHSTQRQHVLWVPDWLAQREGLSDHLPAHTTRAA